MNINTEKKLIKEVSSSHDTEKKSFEVKMKAEYKVIQTRRENQKKRKKEEKEDENKQTKRDKD